MLRDSRLRPPPPQGPYGTLIARGAPGYPPPLSLHPPPGYPPPGLFLWLMPPLWSTWELAPWPRSAFILGFPSPAGWRLHLVLPS